MIFFDLDGTLLDDDVATGFGLDALHAKYAPRMSRTRGELSEVWMRLIDHYFPRYLSGELSMQEQRRARIREILDADSAPVSDDDADAAHGTYLEGYERGWCCFADVVPTLARLSPIPLGVITNGNNQQQRRKLERTGLAPLFTTVVTSDELGIAKPDPRIFAEACRRAGVEPRNAVFIGDNWNADVEGSLAAGLRPIWLRRSPKTTPRARADVATIETLVDLPGLLTPSWISSAAPT